MAREKLLTIRATPEEIAIIKAEAKKAGLPVSQFIRLLIRQWSDGIKFERKTPV